MTRGPRRPWIGVRVDLEPPAEPLLTGCIAAWVDRMRRSNVLGRWFFLWYGAGGVHLRLRLQPARRQDHERLAAALADLDGEPRLWLQPQIYDRTTLAFGETRESVLAELLHVATSELAIALLTSEEERLNAARRWLLTAAAAAVLMRRAIAEPELDTALSAWMAFAASAARRYAGIELQTRGGERGHVGVAALQAVMPRVDAALTTHAAARRAGALLRRARARGERGRFVATHALHLFCNEMGLVFASEYDIACALRSLWQTDAVRRSS